MGHALNHPSGLLISLRHGKIMINSLLRWCSAGLISSYILTVITGIHFYNQLALSSQWLPNLILALFIVLFACLLYIQYRYSEKRIERLCGSENGIQLSSYYVRDHYKTNQRLTGIYVIAIIITGLLMTGTSFSDQGRETGFIMIAGLALYVFGLVMIRTLLKEKCAIRQKINKFGSL